MKKKYLIWAAAFFAVIVVCLVGYNFLSEKYSPQDISFVGSESEISSNKKQTEDFTVLNSSGEKTMLSSRFGKPIVINFWATWCGPCKTELPDFDEAYKKYGGEVEFMMVNLTDGSRDTVKSVKKFVSDNGYTFPVYFDTEYSGANAYEVYSVPMTVFVNSDGTWEKRKIGVISEEDLTNSIEQLLANKNS